MFTTYWANREIVRQASTKTNTHLTNAITQPLFYTINKHLKHSNKSLRFLNYSSDSTIFQFFLELEPLASPSSVVFRFLADSFFWCSHSLIASTSGTSAGSTFK